MDSNKLMYCSCDLICKVIEKNISKADNDLIKALEKAGYIEAKYTIEQAAELENELTEIFQGKTDEFIKLLQDNPEASISDIIDKMPSFNRRTNITADLQALFYSRMSESIPRIAESYIKSIDDELTLQTMTNRTSAWAESWSTELAEIMNVNTEDKLSAILSNGLKEGKSVATVAQELFDEGALESATRARTTAITEMLRANSVSAQEAYVQSPAVSQKKWRHSGSRKTVARENHIDMDGQIVDVDEPFELLGADGKTYYPMYPRDNSLPPGESVNCHCIHQPIVSKDILGLSLEEREKLQDKEINTDNKKWKQEQKELSRKNKKKRAKQYRANSKSKKQNS